MSIAREEEAGTVCCITPHNPTETLVQEEQHPMVTYGLQIYFLKQQHQQHLSRSPHTIPQILLCTQNAREYFLPAPVSLIVLYNGFNFNSVPCKTILTQQIGKKAYSLDNLQLSACWWTGMPASGQQENCLWLHSLQEWIGAWWGHMKIIFTTCLGSLPLKPLLSCHIY